MAGIGISPKQRKRGAKPTFVVFHQKYVQKTRGDLHILARIKPPVQPRTINQNKIRRAFSFAKVFRNLGANRQIWGQFAQEKYGANVSGYNAFVGVNTLLASVDFPFVLLPPSKFETFDVPMANPIKLVSSVWVGQVLKLLKFRYATCIVKMIIARPDDPALDQFKYKFRFDAVFGRESSIVYVSQAFQNKFLVANYTINADGSASILNMPIPKSANALGSFLPSQTLFVLYRLDGDTEDKVLTLYYDSEANDVAVLNDTGELSSDPSSFEITLSTDKRPEEILENPDQAKLTSIIQPPSGRTIQSAKLYYKNGEVFEFEISPASGKGAGMSIQSPVGGQYTTLQLFYGVVVERGYGQRLASVKFDIRIPVGNQIILPSPDEIAPTQ